MTQHAGRHRHIIAVAVSVVLALVGAVVVYGATRTSEGPPQSPSGAERNQSPTVAAPPRGSDATSSPSGGLSAKSSDPGTVLKASPPVAIDIPSIGVRTNNFVNLGLASDGSLEVPTDFSSIGWYGAGPAPGQLGPAILAGHVDSHNGPAIFYRLGALRPGAKVIVSRKDRSKATFVVDRVQSFAKDRFPTALVYGSTTRAELRLITCGGSFDPKSGHYVNNTVAFAHLID